MAKPEVSISFPFLIDEFGNVAKTSDPSKIWSDRVRAVIATTAGERVMRSDFGTDLAKGIFDTRSVMEEKVHTEITTAFQLHLDSLSLLGIEISFDDISNVLSAEVSYSLPNRAIETVDAVIGKVFISGNNRPNEVI